MSSTFAATEDITSYNETFFLRRDNGKGLFDCDAADHHFVPILFLNFIYVLQFKSHHHYNFYILIHLKCMKKESIYGCIVRMFHTYVCCVHTFQSIAIKLWKTFQIYLPNSQILIQILFA